MTEFVIRKLMFSAFHYNVYVWYGMPEHLHARMTISRDMFYCILASKPPLQNKNKNLPPDHKISEKRMLTNFFFLGQIKTKTIHSLVSVAWSTCTHTLSSHLTVFRTVFTLSKWIIGMCNLQQLVRILFPLICTNSQIEFLAQAACY